MGCVVSHKQSTNMNVVSTPRDKLLKADEHLNSERTKKDRAFTLSSTIKEEDEACTEREDKTDNSTSAKQKQPSSSNRSSANKEGDSVESHIKEHFIYYRMDSVTRGKKKYNETTNTIIQRSSSIRGLRDPSFSEFSFKQSMNSSCEKDGDEMSTPRSSRQNMGNVSNNSGESVHKNGDLGATGGLRRTGTPTFNKTKPSGFALQKRYSLKNVRVNTDNSRQVSSITSIIPHELKDVLPHEAGFTFHSLNKIKATNASIDDNSFPSELEVRKFNSKSNSKDTDKLTNSIGATLKSEELRSPSVQHSPRSKPIGRIKIATLGGTTKQDSLDQAITELVKTADFTTEKISEHNDSVKEGKQLNTAEIQAVKSRSELFKQHSSHTLAQNRMEINNESNQIPSKEAEQKVSINNANIINTTTVSTDVLGNTKDTSVASKTGNTDQNSFKVHSPFIRRVDPSKSQPNPVLASGGIISGISTESIKESPVKEVIQAQESPMQKDNFQRKMFPVQLSVHDKFTTNLLDLLKEHSEDFSPVPPIHRSQINRQQSQKSKFEVSGAKNTLQSVDHGSSQITLPTNLLSMRRQDTLTENMIPKNPTLFPSKLLRKGTQDTLPGNASPNTLHSRLLDQDSNLRGLFQGHPQQTLRTENSTMYDRTIYNPEENISAINLTNYVFIYDNEEIEFEDPTGVGCNRQIIPNGLLNQTERHSCLNRRDSLASTGKETDTNKGYQPYDGFESHLKQLEEGSLVGSNTGSKTSIGSVTNIPKLEMKQNPYRPSGYSAFRTPRDQMVSLSTQNSIKVYQNELPGVRNLQKTKSYEIVSPTKILQKQSEDHISEGLIQSKTETELGSNHVNMGAQGPMVINDRINQFRANRQTSILSKSEEPDKNDCTSPTKIGGKDTKSFQNKGHFLKMPNTPVVETGKLDKSRDSDGQKRINNYVLIKELGRGSFGKVKLAQEKFTSHYFAVKIADKEKLKRKMLGRSKDAASTLASEIAIMKKLSHPNVVKLWEVIDDPKEHKLYLVMDYVKKGSVMSENYWKHEEREALERGTSLGLPSSNNANLEQSKKNCEREQKRVLSEEKCLKYFKELILGLDYLHNYVHVIHRDIKPENLLIDQEDNLKISDFGVSQIMDNENNDHLKSNAGTKFFLPPEAFGGKGFHGKPADVWAAGATLYYFLTCKPPFQANNPHELKQKVINEEPVYPPGMNPKIKQVIEGCLQKDPEQRATLQQLMASDWLTEDGSCVGKNSYEPEAEFKISKEDVRSAISGLRLRATILVTAKMKRTLNKTRERIMRRNTSMMEDKNNPFPTLILKTQDSNPKS